MRALELRIPPPLITLLAALLMWLLSSSATHINVPWSVRVAGALVLVIIGLSFTLSGIVLFRRVGTTVHPTHPEAASQLVTHGVYRCTRNPMYLGLVLVLSAWALFLADLLAFAILPLYVLYLTRFQIIPEERALAARFGAAFAAYRARTRRWL